MLGHAIKPVQSRAVRVRNAQWYRDVADLKRRQPFCVRCAAAGVQTVATETDHIVPVAQGGTNHWTNLQRLCYDCHVLKSASEGDAKYVY